MRLATWNVNSLTARMPRVTQWIEMNQPDVLCMQETKLADDKFPEKEFADLGYESAPFGDGRWNGVAIISKAGLADVTRGFGTAEDAYGHRIVSAECAGIADLFGLRPEWSLPRQRVLRREAGMAGSPP